MSHVRIPFIPWNPINAGNLGSFGVRLNRAAKRHGVTNAQIALAWLLWHSPIMIPIPGTSRVGHLEENVAAATFKLTESDLQELSRAA
jgi:aryl-alcohol dehydrogenase-like predicted oxidoreductase